MKILPNDEYFEKKRDAKKVNSFLSIITKLVKVLGPHTTQEQFRII